MANYTAHRNVNLMPLNQLPQGRGDSIPKDVTGILVGIEPRDGYYTFTDANGQEVKRHEAYLAHFEDGQVFSWTVFEDENTGEVKMWDRFDPSINLAACVQQRIAIHVWKDKNNRMHLTLAGQETGQQMQQAQQMQPMPMPTPQQQMMAAQNHNVPW